MEDRKRRFDDRTEVRGKIAESLKKAVGSATSFDGVHIFTPHGDVPDDTALRLLVLPPETWYAREENRLAFEAVLEIIGKNGSKPRYRSNRLLFLAPDHGALSRLNDATRAALAWGSIVEDVKEGRLNIDLLQKNQAEKELKSAEDALPRVARECYKWLLCPVQDAPTDPKPGIEVFALNTTGGSIGGEIERVCADNELIITTWSPIHLRTKLKELYWKDGQNAASAARFFEDTLRYLYLPRLKTRDVLAQAIRAGAASRDFFGTAYGEADGKFEGFSFGGDNVVFDDTLLLIEPKTAQAYEDSNLPDPPITIPNVSTTAGGVAEGMSAYVPSGESMSPGPVPTTPARASSKAKTFFCSAEVPPATAKMRPVQIAEEIVSVLTSDPSAKVRLVIEISADFPEGASDGVRRAVSENASSLGLKSADWE
jgi:hypothetical protein